VKQLEEGVDAQKRLFADMQPKTG